MLTYPWKCTVLHCNHLGNTWKPLVLMTRHFDYCPSASEGDNQRVRSSAPVVSRCFPGGYNVKLYISRGRLAWWLLAFCAVIVGVWLSATLRFPYHIYVTLQVTRFCKLINTCNPISNLICNLIPISCSLWTRFSALGFYKMIFLEESLSILKKLIAFKACYIIPREALAVNPILLLTK